MANEFKNLWIEKYRPTKLDDICLDPDIVSDIKAYTSKGEIPNLLLYGNAGGGKTTLAKIIVNDILDCQYLYINASDENGIDTVRGKIKDFAERMSIDGKIKVIILDEVDGFSADGQKALRNTMETFYNTCRFILTCNALNRIITPVVSRCVLYKLEPPLRQFVLRCAAILKQEGVTIPNGAEFVEYVKKSYPDTRQAINRLQRDSLSGTLITNKVEPKLNIVAEVIDLIFVEKKTKDLRTILIRRGSEFNTDYEHFLHCLFNGIYESDLDDALKSKAMIEISTALYRHITVMDKEINCYACLLRLHELVSAR